MTERRRNTGGLLVNIDVDDLPLATTFYTEAFGLEIGRRFGEDGIELIGWAAPIYLLRKADGSVGAAGQKRGYIRHWTPIHLDIVVEDIDASVARAQKAGAILETATRTHEWGKIALLADPFGHGFCIVEFLGRGYDEIADPA